MQKNEAGGGPVQALFFLKKQALYEVKASSLQLNFQYILIVLKLAHSKDKMCKLLDY